jgi:hypothetical protein
MTDRFRRANLPTTEILADCVDDRDQEVTQASVTVGAFAPFANGDLENACVGVPGTR